MLYGTEGNVISFLHIYMDFLLLEDAPVLSALLMSEPLPKALSSSYWYLFYLFFFAIHSAEIKMGKKLFENKNSLIQIATNYGLKKVLKNLCIYR